MDGRRAHGARKTLESSFNAWNFAPTVTAGNYAQNASNCRVTRSLVEIALVFKGTFERDGRR